MSPLTDREHEHYTLEDETRLLEAQQFASERQERLDAIEAALFWAADRDVRIHEMPKQDAGRALPRFLVDYWPGSPIGYHISGYGDTAIDALLACHEASQKKVVGDGHE